MQKEIGAIAKPRQIMIVPELPKTRSGKIMRRLLKDVAEHREVGDVTTLADSTVMDLIKHQDAAGRRRRLTRRSGACAGRNGLRAGACACAGGCPVRALRAPMVVRRGVGRRLATAHRPRADRQHQKHREQHSRRRPPAVGARRRQAR